MKLAETKFFHNRRRSVNPDNKIVSDEPGAVAPITSAGTAIAPSAGGGGGCCTPLPPYPERPQGDWKAKCGVGYSGCDYCCFFTGPMFCEYLACQNADSAVWIGLVEGTCSWCFALEQFGNPCFAPLMLTFMRTQYRRVFNIPGDTCQDYCCSTYCYCCTALQMKAQGAPPACKCLVENEGRNIERNLILQGMQSQQQGGQQQMMMQQRM
jgi:hypothetical protein